MAYVTFSQAQGVTPIPQQAKLRTISKETTAALWRIVYEAIEVADDPRQDFHLTAIGRVLRGWWVNVHVGMIDEAPDSGYQWRQKTRKVFDLGFPYVYDLAQYILDFSDWNRLDDQIAAALVDTRAAYRVVDKKIVPFSSPEEFSQLTAALDAAANTGAKGSRAHLAEAGACLTRGAWAQAVQECMAAVEGAARFASGEHEMTAGAILAKMQKEGRFKHPALAKALSQLYGYTSDAKGIRHSLVLDDAADVTEREAFLMFGLCASFVTYLLSLK